jgi:hypothetical protein
MFCFTVKKSLCGNRFYKCHRDIAEKASHHCKEASIALKMNLKSLSILEKGLVPLKKSSKVIEIFLKAPLLYTETTISLEMSSKSLVMFIKFSY